MPTRSLSSAALRTLRLVSLATLVLAAAGLAHSQGGGNRLSTQAETEATDSNSTVNNGISGATQLRQPGADTPPGTRDRRPARITDSRDRRELEGFDSALPRPSEFEEYVNRLAFPNQPQFPGDLLTIRRLGTGLITEQNRGGEAIDYSPLVPPDYLISAGDEILLSIWGSVDAELRLVVDRSGRITVPRVGSIMVSGVRYADLPATLSQRVGQTFKNFQLSVSLGQLRGVRVYVTGVVVRPGAYNVNALSSIANAVVRAGGPSASGSFRDIQLRRG
ncbi:MAG TPA: polysaccharide biosynthesis/export family protein, partial [Rubrivivax sp.]|nr:polysaccharide biosynthesis/export family protein [Rubrivivax sp.]